MSLSIQPSEKDPGGFRLNSELLVAESREHVFRFFSDAFELEGITPPWMSFRVTTPSPIEMGEGTLIDYQLRVHGIPMRWRSLIPDWQPPFQFVDEQVKGPYRYWRHLHTFEEKPDGTLIRDAVDYRVPLGKILHPLLVRRDLIKIFDYRRESLYKIFTPSSSQSFAKESFLCQ